MFGTADVPPRLVPYNLPPPAPYVIGSDRDSFDDVADHLPPPGVVEAGGEGVGVAGKVLEIVGD